MIYKLFLTGKNYPESYTMGDKFTRDIGAGTEEVTVKAIYIDEHGWATVMFEGTEHHSAFPPNRISSYIFTQDTQVKP